MNVSKNYNDNSAIPNVSSAIDISPLNYYNTAKFDTPSSGSLLKDRILSLRDTGSRLVSDGRIAEGLECYTASILSVFNILSTMQDSTGVEFDKYFTENVEELNKIAMKYVQHNDTETGHKILTFCDEVTQPVKYGNFPLQRTQTLNNIGCLYRRVGKLKGALNYLRSALMILNKNDMMEHSAVTYLNLSAIQAQMGDRQQAYQNARNALVYAQEEIVLYQDNYDREKYKEKVVTLAIVYHNMGAEEEHLQNLKNALDYYEKAFEVMDEYGIFDEKLYHKFKSEHSAAQERFGSMDKQATRRVVSPMGLPGVSPTTQRPQRQLFETLSNKVSPRGVMFGPTKQTVAPNVEIHHRASSQKTFQFKDKRIVSQPRLGRPPMISTTTPSGPNGWSNTIKPSTSVKAVNPRPLHRDRFSAYKRDEDGTPLASKRPLNKSRSRDTVDSKNNVMSDKEESNIDSDNSQVYYKVPVPVSATAVMTTTVKKPQNDAKFFGKNPTSSPTKETRIKTQDEIKALEDMGVLDWSDQSVDTKRKKQEKQTIKKNQKKFFSGLKNASVTNFNGNFKLMDDSSESSASSSGTSSPSHSKSKTKISRKSNKEQVQQESQSALKNSKGFVEDIIDDPDQVSEVIEDLNSSKASRVTSKAGDISKRQDKSVTNKSEVKMFRDSKVIVSPIKQKDQAHSSANVRPSKIEKGSKYDMMLSWGEFSGLQSKAVVEPEEESSIPTPREVLTKEQMRELYKAQVKAAMFIQKLFRAREMKERAKLVLESKRMKANKTLIRKKWLIMRANKTVGKTIIEREEQDYNLNIFAMPEREALLLVLTEGRTRLRYDAEESYAHLELDKAQPVTHAYNNGLLQQLCDDLIERMYIMDHLLLFKEKKVAKQKDAKDKEYSYLDLEEESEIGTRGAPINFKEHEAKIVKIQSRFRGNQTRQKLQEQKDLNSRSFKFLYKEMVKIDERLVRLRIIQYTATQKIVITGVDMSSKNKFNSLEVPAKFMEGFGRKQDDATNKLEFDFDTFEISLLPSVEAELYPEKKKKAIRKVNIVTIVRIQSLVRRYLARKMFKLKLKKSRESPGMKLLKKYVTNVNRCLFIVRIHHNKELKQEPNQESQERNQFIVTAKSSDYHANIPPLTIPLEEVDKTEFCDNTTNVKRLVDILVPYIKIDFTKAETFVLVFNKREYDRSTRRFESQLMNFNIFESAGGEQHEEEKTEVQKKIWNFLQEKNFLETNKHIIKNFLGLQTAVATVKITEENEARIQNFGSIEDGAARKIQKFYRKILMTRYFNTIGEKDRMSGSKISASQILSNSVRSKSYSLFCEAYKRMMMSEDELHRQSTNEYSFVKSVSNIKFINTKLEAKAHVFFNKTNPKDKTIDIEIFMPLIGLHQYEKIPESDVFQNSIKPSSFQKKVEEHLISKLEYNPVTKKVKFMKDGIKASEADMMEHAKQTLSTFIHAKLIRLKYLRRKIMTKNMVPIGVHTSEVDRLFISMSSFWHPHQKQLRILLERIDDLVHHKDIIVKFDIQQSNKELRKLIDNPNADPKELCEKLKPYADYISKHIILQPDAKSGSGSKKDFKMMMDGTVFKIEFVNSRFVVASIKDISEDTLKDILAKGKTSVKASKLLDVKQLESLFPKNIDLKDILNNDRKDNEDQDAVELLKKSERLDSKDEGQLKASTKKRLDKTKALVIIQKMVRGNADRQKYDTMRARKLAEQMKKQSFGVRVKKMSKKIEENYWTITAYMKVLDENARMYYFFASNLTDNETPDKIQARGIFRADNMLILNSDGRELVDALLDRIEIIGQSIEFNLERDNFVKFGTPEEQGKGVVMREVKLDTEVFNAETRRGQQEEKVKGGESARMTELENENDSPLSSRRLTTAREEQPTEPVIGSEHEYIKKKSSKAAKGGEEEEKKVKKDPLPENLLNQKTEAQSNNLLLYNVYYNNDETQLKPAPNPLLTESKKDPRHRTRKQSISLATDNVVKISVDLKELRKYNPNLDPKSPADLKMIANELANSIQVNEKGHILINDSKVNPNALKLLEKQLDVVENPVKDFDQDAKYSQKKKILFKMTKAYGDKKYLLLINYLEKPSNLNNILSIVRKEDDQVYEEFELFIEVNVVCLSNNAIRPITWELSLKEGQSLSGLVNATEVAKFFAANIHLFGDQILLSTPFQPSVNYKNVMIMNENAIKMIQNRFRTKKFAKNFTRFRNNLIVNRTSIIARAVIAINNVSYHVLGYENSKDQDLQVEVWSLINYERSMVSVNKKLVEKLYAMDKKKTFNSIFKFLRFELNKKKEYELVLKEKTMFDYLKLNGEF